MSRFFLIAAVLCLLWSCNADRDAAADAGDKAHSSIVEIGASFAARNMLAMTRVDDGSEPDTDPGESDTDSNPGTDPGEPEVGEEKTVADLIPYKLELDENTILHVSQRAQSASITQTPFVNDAATYSYHYMPSHDDYELPDGIDSPWNDDNCYNFTPYMQSVDDEMLEWKKILDLGTVGNGYAMYCLHFPLSDVVKKTTNDNGAITYYVEKDQSKLENLMKSDILGGYHSTPAIFTRIKFRLFHLMTYVRIRLYVPVFREDLNTGYREDALLSATINEVNPNFAIDWGAQITTDAAGPVVTPLAGNEEIKMYKHPIKEGQEHKIVEIEYGKYLSKDMQDQGLGKNVTTDKVRIYDFSVIIPKQVITENKEDGTITSFTSTDFLSFYLRSNAGGATKYDFTQRYTANTNESTLEMLQGNFQYLQLYVPRVGDQLIMINANVIKWGQRGIDMALSDEPEESAN